MATPREGSMRKRLEAALVPLASPEASVRPDRNDDEEITITVTVGDVRRARAALAEGGETRPDDDAIRAVAAELTRARSKHGPMRGAHEGYAVLLEEVDELWDEVKRQGADKDAMRKEALQVAAMGVRFAVDVCGLTRSGGEGERR